MSNAKVIDYAVTIQTKVTWLKSPIGTILHSIDRLVILVKKKDLSKAAATWAYDMVSEICCYEALVLQVRGSPDLIDHFSVS